MIVGYEVVEWPQFMALAHGTGWSFDYRQM